MNYLLRKGIFIDPRFSKKTISSFLLHLAGESPVLGELQAAYLVFLLGQSLLALEQWKALVTIICESPLHIKNMAPFYETFLGEWGFDPIYAITSER